MWEDIGKKYGTQLLMYVSRLECRTVLSSCKLISNIYNAFKTNSEINVSLLSLCVCVLHVHVHPYEVRLSTAKSI